MGIYGLTAGGHTYSSDEEGILATTRALVERRSPVLVLAEDEAPVTPVRAGRNGEVVGVSGLGQSLVAVPLYLAGALAGASVADSYVDYTERIFVGWTNPVITALGAVFVLLLAGLLGAGRRWAVVLALIYGLSTMAWPHAKTFFSEPLATTLVLAATYFAVRSTRSGRAGDMAWSGACAGLALLARSSTGLFAPLIFVYLVGRAAAGAGGGWRRVVRTAAAFAAGSALPVAAFFASNWWRYGSPFDLGYPSVPLGYPLPEGLYGLFLSPGKSLFLYAPAALVGLLAAPFARRHRPEVALLVALGTANAVFFARFPYWHGDHAWGPRYLIMTLPFFVLPVAPLLERPRWRRALAVAGVVGALSALLGVAMYFNQYFHIAERALGSEVAADGPVYWRSLHYDPEWSPLLGHVKAVPDIVANSWARLDGEDPDLAPFPGGTTPSYGWYFAPAQVDSWAYWLFPAHGPKKLLVFVPVFAAAAGAGAVLLVRPPGRRSPGRRPRPRPGGP